mgnify:CR=1 FL=1
MQPNKDTIIEFALKLRQGGQIVDRNAFNQISDWEFLEDCMLIWQQYLNSHESQPERLLENQLSKDIHSCFTSMLGQIEQQHLKWQKQAEDKIESLHRHYNNQHNQALIQQNKLIEQVAQLKETLQLSQKQNNQLQSDFDQIFCQAEQSRHLIDQKEEENRSLWRQLEELTSDLDEQKVIFSERMNEQKRSQNSETIHHQQLESRWHEQINEQARIISEQNEYIRTLRANLQQAEQKLKFANEQQQTDSQKRQTHQQDQASESEHLHQAITQLTDQNESLKQQLDLEKQNNQDQHHQLNKTIAELTDQNHHLNSQLEDNNAQQRRQSTASDEKSHQLIQKAQRLEEKHSQAQILLARQEEEIHHLKNEQEYKLEQLSQQHQRALEHEEYQFRLKTEQYQKLEKKLSGLQSELDKQIELREAANSDNRQKIRKQEEQIKHLTQDIKAAKKQLSTSRLACENLSEELCVAQNKLAGITEKDARELENAQKTIQMLKAEIKQLQANYQQV